MENIFIVLAIIASVVYKFYENYKKEMEEAAKRQQKARRVPPTVDSDTMPPPPTPRPMSLPRPTVQLPPRPAIPVPEIRKPTSRKTVSPTPKLRIEPLIPREMTQANRLRTERKQNQVLEVLVDEEDIAAEALDQTEVAFDLKTAVIQSTILERPYQ